MLDPSDWKSVSDCFDQPLLMVVVDTEEEFDWAKPFYRDQVSTSAIASQQRAHRIFDKYGIRPTYVIDFPVASQASGYGPLKELFDDGKCQIGAHLHPWVCPPHDETVNNRNSYPGNLPRDLEKQKLARLTDEIAERFGERPVVYKAGRYGVGPNTADILAELGYKIDASVVPWTDFRIDEGPDFRHCGAKPYWFGSAGLLEIPLSAGFTGVLSGTGWTGWNTVNTPLGRRLRLTGLCSRLRLLDRLILTPEGITHEEHKRLTRTLLRSNHRLFSFTYHSPSLEPGFTPYVRNDDDLAVFLDRFDRYFDFFVNEIGGRPTTPDEVYSLVSAAP
ncbi:MAG: polysaccharide deacetylase family protein [Alphaproteobacteria bacterium]